MLKLRGSNKVNSNQGFIVIAVSISTFALFVLAILLTPLNQAAAATQVVLHLQGNTNDMGGDPPTPCTGSGAADLISCDGPFLLESPVLDPGPAAHWDITSPALDGTGGRTIYDPNWIWNSGPTRLGGNMIVEWWASCTVCGPTAKADWNIRLWADGAKVFEQRITATPSLPNVAEKLSTTLFLPEIVANSNIVLHIDPVFIDSQNATHIYYDSQLPCPTATGTAACDSKVTMPVLAAGEPAPTPNASPTPTQNPYSGPVPRFFNYVPTNGLGANAGEPTVGVNWETGKVMFIASLQTLQVTFDDSASPARATWLNKSAPNTSVTSLDPILWTDGDIGGISRTNRTFVSQLVGKVSAMAFTDDDGETWTPSQGSGINSGVDHQTVGGGPYAKNPDGSLKGNAVQRPGPNGRIYPNAVYYASQDIGLAQIARSDDGGFTFGPAVPMFNLTECEGLHGQIKVAQDGTIYVPIPVCGGKQGLVVSEDNGLTWELRLIPGSTESVSDPSVGIGADGTLYYGYSDNGDSVPKVAVSRDKGRNWINISDVGASVGIKNVSFPSVIAGDSDRAAIFFLGSTTGGSSGVGQDLGAFNGAWYGYIAMTYDRGNTWITVNATPDDPVQLGPICGQGTLCADGSRELLDFNDLTVDKQGRVIAAFADGCVTAQCVQGQDRSGAGGQPDGLVNGYDNDKEDKATIIRQSGGKTLFAEYDSLVTNKPAAPFLVAGQDGNTVNLNWSEPDNGGSAITGYNIYRAVQGGTATLLARVAGDVNSYSDSSGGSGSYSYQVSAVNANGEGAKSVSVVPKIVESPCKLPGITILTDTSDAAPNTPAVPGVNIKSIHVAEPYADGANRLIFTLKVGAGALPANSQWYLIWQRPQPDANHDRNYLAMRTDLAGKPTFEHGRVSYPLAYTSPAPNQGNLPTRFGNIEGSYEAATGTIRFVVPNDKVDNVTAGSTLLGTEARSFLGRNDMLPINQNVSSDFAGAGDYQLVGNNSCLLPPGAPTALTAISPQKGVIQLSWTDNSADEENFLIERSATVDGSFVEIASVGSNVVTFTDTTIQRKTPYYYRIRAARGTAKSGYSNIASARTK
jgi:hypothetical protein